MTSRGTPMHIRYQDHRQHTSYRHTQVLGYLYYQVVLRLLRIICIDPSTDGNVIKTSLGAVSMVNALFVPLALFASVSRRGMTTQLQSSSMSSMASLLDTNGEELSGDTLRSKLANKRVALYFAAGWCPMCTAFEPALIKFQKDAEEQGTPMEIVYVSSDRSSADQANRASSMNMMSVRFEQAADFKRKYNIWAGSESAKFGVGRRSGVPAIVVLDKNAEEMAFVAAESQGVKSLGTWPLQDESGIW